MHNSGRRGHKEGERVHLLRYIVVTALVSHLDTSELNFSAKKNTAREGAPKKRKDQPTTNNNKTVPFPKKTTTKVTKRVRIVI